MVKWLLPNNVGLFSARIRRSVGTSLLAGTLLVGAPSGKAIAKDIGAQAARTMKYNVTAPIAKRLSNATDIIDTTLGITHKGATAATKKGAATQLMETAFHESKQLKEMRQLITKDGKLVPEGTARGLFGVEPKTAEGWIKKTHERWWSWNKDKTEKIYGKFRYPKAVAEFEAATGLTGKELEKLTMPQITSMTEKNQLFGGVVTMYNYETPLSGFTGDRPTRALLYQLKHQRGGAAVQEKRISAYMASGKELDKIVGHHPGRMNTWVEETLQSDFTAGKSYDPKVLNSWERIVANNFQLRVNKVGMANLDFVKMSPYHQRRFVEKALGIDVKFDTVKSLPGKIINDEHFYQYFGTYDTRSAKIKVPSLSLRRKINEVLQVSSETNVKAKMSKELLKRVSAWPLVHESGERIAFESYYNQKIYKRVSATNMLIENMKKNMKEGINLDYVSRGYRDKRIKVPSSVKKRFSILSKLLEMKKSSIEDPLIKELGHTSRYVLDFEAYGLGKSANIYGRDYVAKQFKKRMLQHDAILREWIISPKYNREGYKWKEAYARARNRSYKIQYKSFIAQGASGKPFDLFDPSFRNFKGSLGNYIKKNNSATLSAEAISNIFVKNTKTSLISNKTTGLVNNVLHGNKVNHTIENAAKKASSTISKSLRNVMKKIVR